MVDSPTAPKQYSGVTVSSTFTDLIEHRAAVIKALQANGLYPVAMENDDAKPEGDVVDSSLQMVRDGSAYIGIISKKYGQIPPSLVKNPESLSITELEFNEAIKQNRPVLLFIMGKEHLVHEDEIELDPAKRIKLEEFKSNAKKTESGLNRIYSVFNSLEDFTVKVNTSVARLKALLDTQNIQPTAISAPTVYCICKL